MQRHEQPASPARRVYYDFDEATSPDRKLAAAFERTNPGLELVDEDETTGVYWALPALGLLVAGFFIGKWWTTRKKDGAVTTVAGDDYCGFDDLGAD